MAGNDSFTKLLLHMDGADASTTFTDSSSVARAITANGNAQIDTAQSVFGGASGLFDGTGDTLSGLNGADLDFGTQDFTVDFWVRYAALSTYIISDYDAGAVSTSYSITDAAGTVAFVVNWGTGQQTINHQTVVTTGQWYHFALVRNGAEIAAYIDGVKSSSTLNPGASSLIARPGNRLIGTAGDFGTFFLNGHLDEFRISVGIARWTANFTPPTSAYSAGSGLTTNTMYWGA